jgi:hypothetical protein
MQRKEGVYSHSFKRIRPLGWDIINTDPEISPDKWNVLEFKDNVQANDVEVVRSGVNLWFKLAGSTEGVAQQGFFSGDEPGTGINNPVQEVKFSDGTSWDIATLTAKAFIGTAGTDNITGTSVADLIDGRAGNDKLNGGDGNDIYVFSKGDGQDIIHDNQGSKAISEIPGVGLLTATAAVATMGDAKASRSGREFAAWAGLVPRQTGTGGKTNLHGISKRGDTYLRTLLIHGARSGLTHAKEPGQWVEQMKQRQPPNVVM